MSKPPIPERPTAHDQRAVALQLGRRPHPDFLVACRGGCGLPAVIETAPRLRDGSPFPTRWYLTCVRLTAAVSTLESSGFMVSANERLATDPGFRAQYRAAHDAYVSGRDAVLSVPEIAGVSGGGMPDRVKCLHALVAHSLAVGPGVNPVGDQVVAELTAAGTWPCARPCVDPAAEGDSTGGR